MEKKTIGWIGLGTMGNPMAMRLLKMGYDLIIYSRNAQKAIENGTVGARLAANTRELIMESDIIFLMLPDDDASNDVFFGTNGLRSTSAKGKVFINMSTVTSLTSKTIAEACIAGGNDYIDAPVAGNAIQAKDGKLIIMAGGDKKTFTAVKPLLDKLGKLTMLIGGYGAGNAAKLSMNMLLAFQAQGLSEAFYFAKEHDVRQQDLAKLINNSAMGSSFLKLKAIAIICNNFPPVFALKNMAKSLRMVKAEGIRTPLAEATYETFQQADKKLGNEDVIAVYKQIS